MREKLWINDAARIRGLTMQQELWINDGMRDGIFNGAVAHSPRLIVSGAPMVLVTSTSHAE